MPDDFPWNSPTGVGADFQATAWSDLRALATGNDPARQREALERLCRVYWKPLYAFIRRQGNPPDAARELTQDFFCHLLKKERIKLADQKRGRFRSFLLKSLQHFLISDWDRRCAKKRDTRLVVSLDVPLGGEEGEWTLDPVAPGESPDRAFDLQWARELFAQVRQRLEAELAAPDKHALRTLLPVALREETEVSYAELGRQLGKSEDAIKKAIERLRARWEALVREEVAATVQSTEDVETELRELLALVSSR